MLVHAPLPRSPAPAASGCSPPSRSLAPGLLEEVHRRLVDATWLDRTDLRESLHQMQRGESHVIATR